MSYRMKINRYFSGLLVLAMTLTLALGSVIWDPVVVYARPTGAAMHEYEEPVYMEVSDEEMIRIAAMAEAETDTIDGFWENLRQLMMKREPTFAITYNGSIDDLPKDSKTIIAKLRELDDKTTSDDADFLTGSILKIGYTCQFTSKKALFQYAVKYTDTAEQLKKVNAAVEKQLAKLKISQLNDVAKVKAIHDFVVNTISYDQTLTDHSVYGGLLDKKHSCVCQGYSLLTYKMLTDAGLEAHYVTGWAGENHAWNIVKLDNKWYFLDVTWDDPISNKPQLVYDYFTIGQKTISKDHELGADYAALYKVTDTDYKWKSKIKSSAKPSEKSAAAAERNKYVKTLTSTLQTNFQKMLLDVRSEGYEIPEDYESELFLLYNKIVTTVVGRISDEKYRELINGNSDLLKYMLDNAGLLVEQRIIDPAIQYVESDEFLADAYEAIIADLANGKFTVASEESMKLLAAVGEAVASTSASETIPGATVQSGGEALMNQEIQVDITYATTMAEIQANNMDRFGMYELVVDTGNVSPEWGGLVVNLAYDAATQELDNDNHTASRGTNTAFAVTTSNVTEGIQVVINSTSGTPVEIYNFTIPWEATQIGPSDLGIVTATAGSTSKVYDGTPLTYTDPETVTLAFQYDLPTIFDYKVTSATINGTLTDAGSTDNEITGVEFSIVDANGETVHLDYDPEIVYVNGTLTVTPAPVTVAIDGNSGSFDYDGTEHTVTGYNIAISGAGGALFDETNVNFGGTAAVSRTDAGTSYMGLDDSKFNCENGNFDVTFMVNDGYITVNPLPADDLGLLTHGYGLTYDGAPHAADVSVDVTEGTTLEYSTDDGATWSTTIPAFTDAGDHGYMVRASNPNYETKEAYGEVDIERAVAEVIADDITIVEGDAEPTLTATEYGLIGSDTVTYSVARDPGDTMGTYTITPTGAATQGNYNVTYGTGTFTILGAATAIGLTVADYSGEYDGAAHTGTVNVAVTAGTTIEYSEDGVTWTTEAPSITEVGSMTYEVRASNAAYETAHAAMTLTVTPKTVTVTAEDTSKTYGTTDPAFTAAVSGTIGSDTITYTLSRTDGEDTGTYQILPAGNADQGNYTVNYIPGVLTVLPAEVTVVPDDITKTAGEADPELTAAVTGLVGSDTVDYTLSREAGEEAGTYTITAAGDENQGNYTVAFGTGTLTIEGSASSFAEEKTKAEEEMAEAEQALQDAKNALTEALEEVTAADSRKKAEEAQQHVMQARAALNGAYALVTDAEARIQAARDIGAAEGMSEEDLDTELQTLDERLTEARNLYNTLLRENEAAETTAAGKVASFTEEGTSSGGTTIIVPATVLVDNSTVDKIRAKEYLQMLEDNEDFGDFLSVYKYGEFLIHIAGYSKIETHPVIIDLIRGVDDF